MKERRNIVEPAKQVSMALEEAIQDRLISGKLPCKEAWEIDKKDYYTQTEEMLRANPTSMQTPALTCPKCQENSVYRAVKCAKCEHVFLYGKPGDFADRCPECGFSKMEDDRQKAREALQAG